MKLYHFLYGLALVVGMTGCELPVKEPEPASTPSVEAFDYAMTMDVALSGTFRSGSNAVLPGVPFEVYSGESFETAALIASGATDQNGSFTMLLNVPTAVQQIFLTTSYIGLPSAYEVPIRNGRADFSIASVINVGKTSLGKSGTTASVAAFPPVKYLGTWRSDGTPNYLLPQRDIVDAGLLARLNESLPEAQSLVATHPEYLTASDKSIQINQLADVWVTFIHEGAGYKNVLGFYTYPTTQPPTSVDQIDSIVVIFPNVSYSGSGGGLQSGDKVLIGRFGPNTSIGWVVFSNGYVGTSVTLGSWQLFSNQALNGVSNPSLRQHNVLLNDAGFDRVILGFEDIKRSTGGDQDFNDCMFSVTSSPVAAIVTQDLAQIDVPVDADGDGVTDSFDAYPNDPARAFNSYTPALNSYNTLAFEDLWPGRGDEDFNDLVISYNAQNISNARNEIVEVRMKFILKAIGASYALGFGTELPVNPSQVQSVTYSRSGLTQQLLSANGTEAGQTKATLILFDDAYAVMQRNKGAYVNTESSGGYVQPETLHVSILFSSPQNPSVAGSAPYNPFIFVNERSREIHLPNQPPTTLGSTELFRTSFDNSQPGIGQYYITREGKPWALNIPTGFEYPWERTKIETGYLHFVQWAQTKGTSYSDWYGTKSGYRDATKLWKR